jgi:hypothetical protein
MKRRKEEERKEGRKVEVRREGGRGKEEGRKDERRIIMSYDGYEVQIYSVYMLYIIHVIISIVFNFLFAISLLTFHVLFVSHILIVCNVFKYLVGIYTFFIFIHRKLGR